MTTISAKTKDQVLTAVESPTVASGDKNTVDFSVELDEFWSGLTASAVFFTARNPQAVYEKILEKGKTQIPSEVLKNKGYMYIGIRAVDGEGGVKTSTVLKYRIEDGAPVGTATAEGPTPDVYQQLIAICSNIKDKTDALDSTIQMNTQELGKTKEYLNELTDKKITKFYASNLGENHLEDSDNGKIQDMFIYGRSEQKQYKGYNLLKDENVIVFNDGNYICSNQKYLNEGTIEIVTGETYTFSLGVVSTDGQIKLFDDSNNLIKSIYISNKRIFTFIVPENVVSMSYYAKITTDSTASLEKAKAMLIVGSEELAYEPYVGGIPSPNPDYPQEIRNVLNPSVMICGKNLIQCEDGKEYKLSDTTSNYIGVLVNYSGKINTQKGKNTLLVLNMKLLIQEYSV